MQGRRQNLRAVLIRAVPQRSTGLCRPSSSRPTRPRPGPREARPSKSSPQPPTEERLPAASAAKLCLAWGGEVADALLDRVRSGAEEGLEGSAGGPSPVWTEEALGCGLSSCVVVSCLCSRFFCLAENRFCLVTAAHPGRQRARSPPHSSTVGRALQRCDPSVSLPSQRERAKKKNDNKNENESRNRQRPARSLLATARSSLIPRCHAVTSSPGSDSYTAREHEDTSHS